MAINFNNRDDDTSIKFLKFALEDKEITFFPVNRDVFDGSELWFLVEKDDFDKRFDELKKFGFTKSQRWTDFNINNEDVYSYFNDVNISIIPVQNAKEWFNALFVLQTLILHSGEELNGFKNNKPLMNKAIWRHFFFLERFKAELFPVTSRNSDPDIPPPAG